MKKIITLDQVQINCRDALGETALQKAFIKPTPKWYHKDEEQLDELADLRIRRLDCATTIVEIEEVSKQPELISPRFPDDSPYSRVLMVHKEAMDNLDAKSMMKGVFVL